MDTPFEEYGEFLYIVRGRVMPPRVQLNISQGIQFDFQFQNESARLRFYVHRGFVSGEVYLEKEIESDLGQEALKNHVRDHVHSITDVLSLWGGNYRVDINNLVRPDGSMVVFGIEEPRIKEHAEEILGPSDEYPFQRIIFLLDYECSKYLRRALEDYRLAIARPVDTGFFAYRAIESVREYFKEIELNDSESKERSWKQLREVLNIERESLQEVKDNADTRRHGGIEYFNAVKREKYLKISWTVLHKFIGYAHEKYDES